mgnify:CR=1
MVYTLRNFEGYRGQIGDAAHPGCALGPYSLPARLARTLVGETYASLMHSSAVLATGLRREMRESLVACVRWRWVGNG